MSFFLLYSEPAVQNLLETLKTAQTSLEGAMGFFLPCWRLGPPVHVTEPAASASLEEAGSLHFPPFLGQHLALATGITEQLVFTDILSAPLTHFTQGGSTGRKEGIPAQVCWFRKVWVFSLFPPDTVCFSMMGDAIC